MGPDAVPDRSHFPAAGGRGGSAKRFLLRWERWIASAALAVVFAGGYYSLDLYLAGARGIRVYDFSCAWDPRIPVIPWMIWPYGLFFPFCLLLLPLLTTRERFFRTLLAIFLEFVLALVVFLLFPSRIVRPEVTDQGVSADVLRWFYALDPGYNIFPSLHVAMAVLVPSVFFRFGSRYARPVLLMAVLIIVSTVVVKAHYLLDIPAGMALAALAIRLAWIGSPRTVEPHDPIPGIGAAQPSSIRSSAKSG